MDWDTVISSVVVVVAVVIGWFLNSISQNRQRKHDAAQLERTLAENRARERRDAIREIRRQQAERFEEFLQVVEQYQGHLLSERTARRTVRHWVEEAAGRSFSDEDWALLEKQRLAGRPNPGEIIRKYTGLLVTVHRDDLREKLLLLQTHAVVDREFLEPAEVTKLLMEVREIVAEGIVDVPEQSETARREDDVHIGFDPPAQGDY